MSNFGTSSDDSIPVVILVSKSGKTNRPTPKRKSASASHQLPWLWIAGGGCAAWVLIVVAVAATSMTRDPDQVQPNAAALARRGAVEPAFQVRPVVPEEAVEVDVVEPKLPVREAVDEAPAFDVAPPAQPIKAVDKRLFANCEQIGTKVVFMRDPPEAFKRAKAERKMVFVVHLSGNLEDKDFT